MLRIVLVFSVATLLGLFVQGTLIRPLSVSAVAPDFILILVVYLGLHIPTVGGLLGAFVLGLVSDFAAAEFVGPGASGAVVAFCLTVTLSKKVYAESPPATMIVTAVCSLAKSLVCVLILYTYLDVNALSTGTPTIIYEALLSGLVAPFVIRAMHLSKRRT